MLNRWGIPLGTLSLSAAAALAALPAPAASGPQARGPAAALAMTRATATRGPAAHGPAAAPHGPVQQGGPEGGALIRPATSTNWSGYVATGRSYTSVSASWVQPSVSCGPGGGYSSFWVGLDGYSSSGTVEQIGTDSDCSGRPRYYGWYEMYPDQAHNLRGAISPGDTVRASVTSAGGGSYTLVLADETRGWRTALTRSLSGAPRSSAEVVAEAPSSNGGIMPLAPFGTLRVTGARVNGAPVGEFSPTRVTMTTGGGTAKATVSPLRGGDTFRITWRHPA